MENVTRVNEIKVIERMKTSELGLKIVVAKNKTSDKYFPVIIEVNPNGTCHKDIEPGDILLSINGIDIRNFQILNNFALMESDKNGNVQRIQLKIQKKGAFEVPGLFGACFNSPCTEFCKLSDFNRYQMHLRNRSFDGLGTTRKGSTNNIDSVRKDSEKSINFKLHTNESHEKVKDLTCSEESSQSSLISTSGSNQFYKNAPKYKFHQKALPMKKRENEQKSYRTTLKPKKDVQSHIIQPPQPLFIKRKNNQVAEIKNLSNLKESISLTNLSSVSNESTLNHHSNSIPLTPDSNTDLSCDESSAYVPKMRRPGKSQINDSIPFDRRDGNLRNSKGLSKSIDLLITNKGQEF